MKKKEIRQFVKEKRKYCDASFVKEANTKIKNTLCQLNELQRAKVVYIYVDFNNEVGTRDIIEYLFTQNKEVAVPKIEEGIMNFYKISDLSQLEEGYYGIPEPVNKIIPKTPDIVIVPGVAFSLKRERLGYGKGFYDRFLNDKVIKVGLSYEFQLFDSLPVDEHDVNMNYVITESRLLKEDI